MVLESAIPPHLHRERTLPVKTPVNYEPPFPAYSARFPTDLKDFVMAVIAAQYRNGSPATLGRALAKLNDLLDQCSASRRPRYRQASAVTDNSGAYNEVLIAYWQSKADYTEWASTSGFDEWWRGLDPEVEQHGWFLEVFSPSVDRFETVFSDNVVPEGAAHMRDGVSGEIREHVYWGSMRDRLPVAQTDALEGVKGVPKPKDNTEASLKQRIRVPGRQNLTVIRSGQDWSNTLPDERKLYLETMHPVLIKGMNFLRDNGDEIGCFSCRFMDVIEPKSGLANTDKTFGLAYFDDLGSLAGWSKQHKTHLDIFGGFLKYAKELQNNVSLRLFHEVLVLEPDQQFFEYVGCHAKTGMLAAVQTLATLRRP